LACDQTGFRALRVDELKGPFNIHREIIQNIFQSEAVIIHGLRQRGKVYLRFKPEKFRWRQFDHFIGASERLENF
jgi:hypothetical protein